jgi:hypothetical protein
MEAEIVRNAGLYQGRRVAQYRREEIFENPRELLHPARWR